MKPEFMILTHEDRPKDFVLLLCQGDIVTHWMDAHGQWVMLPEENEVDDWFKDLVTSGELPSFVDTEQEDTDA